MHQVVATGSIRCCLTRPLVIEQGLGATLVLPPLRCWQSLPCPSLKIKLNLVSFSRISRITAVNLPYIKGELDSAPKLEKEMAAARNSLYRPGQQPYAKLIVLLTTTIPHVVHAAAVPLLVSIAKEEPPEAKPGSSGELTATQVYCVSVD